MGRLIIVGFVMELISNLDPAHIPFIDKLPIVTFQIHLLFDEGFIMTIGNEIEINLYNIKVVEGVTIFGSRESFRVAIIGLVCFRFKYVIVIKEISLLPGIYLNCNKAIQVNFLVLPEES